MTFETYDLSVFISCKKEEVAAAWRSSGTQEQWFISQGNYIDEHSQPRPPHADCEAGDNYWWEWFDRSVETGIVTKVDEGGIEFTYGMGAHVIVSWENVHDGTLVKLSQVHDIEDLEVLKRTYFSTAQNWAFYLTNLKAFLEHGIDVRDQTPTRNDHVNV